MKVVREVTKASPSLWTVRNGNSILSYHAKVKDATKWLASHRPDVPMRDLLDTGYRVDKAYTAEARFVRKNGEGWDPEWIRPGCRDFGDAMNQLRGWCHVSWEQERDNHPSTIGRQAAWERWHDVIALIQLADLTLLKEPQFNYDFGSMSPPEGLGNRLKLAVYPTPEAELKKLVRHHV